jgi:tRNA 5-methylaminomethyl-2-thiouridine biosynthesis bifunctional protein
MNSAPIEPAALSFTDDGIPFSKRYGDIYHPRAGALIQARHVFIGGNGLPSRWQGRDCFVVLETGFGLGNNFLATWQSWRDDPQRCGRLVFVSLEAHPLTRAELESAHAASALPELATDLLRAWPPLTTNLHTLDFDDGRVRLLLAFGDVHDWLPELVTTVDAFYLDGFAPASNPRMWDARVCKAIGRLAAPGATLATWSAAHALRAHLATAGFEVRLAQGTGGKRDITLARFSPAFTPRRAPARGAVHPDIEPRALIVGGGLAGCAAAWALAEQGWRSTIFERQPQLASQASGNAGGLFHGIVNAQDGVHARFNRAAALMAQQAVQIALASHGVAGAVDGLLRLENTASLAAMRETLRRLGLPADYVRALDADEASQVSGIALQQPSWFYPGGGWVHPAGLARALLERAAPNVELRVGTGVQTLQRTDAGWRLLDAAGAVLDEAPTVVLANAADASRLLGGPDWPIDVLRGQVSRLPASSLGSLRLPRIPVAGSGYLLPELPDGGALFGATVQRDDDDASVREADHRENLAQLARLLGHAVDADPATMQGRSGWRWSAADRLPLIGAVPDTAGLAAQRLDQPRFVPRIPGLFVFAALGSRGIAWSALGARTLASWVTGAPAPMEASLIDAVDPARFVSREARRLSKG